MGGFAKVDVNTSPIPAGILNPKNFSYPSGGGGGGGGGPVNFMLGGADGAKAASPGAVNVAPGATEIVCSGLRTYRGMRTGLGLTILSYGVSASPYGGFNHQLIGNLSVTVQYQTGKTTVFVVTPQMLAQAVPIHELFGTDAEVNATFKVTVTNNLVWQKTDPPVEVTPATAQVVASLIALEM